MLSHVKWSLTAEKSMFKDSIMEGPAGLQIQHRRSRSQVRFAVN